MEKRLYKPRAIPDGTKFENDSAKAMGFKEKEETDILSEIYGSRTGNTKSRKANQKKKKKRREARKARKANRR